MCTNTGCTSQYRPELVGQRPGQHLSQSVVSQSLARGQHGDNERLSLSEIMAEEDTDWSYSETIPKQTISTLSTSDSSRL